MVTAIISYQLKNFSDFKKGFDQDAAHRSSFGLHVKKLYQSTEDPNKVSVLLEAQDPESVKRFVASPDLKKAMEQYGIIAAPEVKILNEVRILTEA